MRLRFAKRGDLRLVSHHDLMRTLERTLRRADLPVARSQGFNPRPKIVFALALGLGIEGRREVVDLELTETLNPVDVLTRLAAAVPPGLEFLEAQIAPPGRAPRPLAVWYALEVPEPRREAARAAATTLLAETSRPYTRRRRDRADTRIDLRPFVLDAGLDPDGVLRFRLNVGQDGSARPEEVLDTLNLRDLLDAGTILARTEIELAPTP